MRYWIEIDEFFEKCPDIFDLKTEIIGNCVETFECKNLKEAQKQIEQKLSLNLDRVLSKNLKELYIFKWCLPKYLRDRNREDLTIRDFIGSKMLRLLVENPTKSYPKIYHFSIN
jgi:spore coat polysaccharide biosynthesis protein SpsF (cytidylyltransferase family)